MKKIISIVGVSVFENFKKKYNKNNSFIKYYDTLSDKDYSFANWNLINQDEDIDIPSIRERLVEQVNKKSDYWNNSNISAEISSTIKICEQEPDTEFQVHLIATDTVLSILAAKMICDWFKDEKNQKYHSIKPENILFKQPQNIDFKQKDSNHIIKNLRISDKDEFSEGFMNLIEVLDNLTKKKNLKTKDRKKVPIEYIFNITGGYKAIVPIVTLLAQIKEIPLKYIYNETDLSKTDLIEVGSLPFNFDFEVAKNATQFLNNNFIKSNKPDTRNPNQEYIKSFDENVKQSLINHGLLVEKNKKIEVSSLGKILISFFENDSSVGKSTLGLFMEYKYYEFFNEINSVGTYNVSRPEYEYWYDSKRKNAFDIIELKELYKVEVPHYKNVREIISHINQNLSENEKLKTIGDTDLKLNTNDSTTLCEVKSYDKIGELTFEKILHRIKANKKKFPHETIKNFALLAYKINFQFNEKNPFLEWKKESSKKLVELKKLNDLLQKKSDCKLRVFITSVPLIVDSLKVNYDQLLKKKLSVEEFLLT